MIDTLAGFLNDSPVALFAIYFTIFACVIANVFLTLFIGHAMRHSSRWPGKGESVSEAIAKGQKVSVCAVIGSGGHTTEMCALLRQLDSQLFTERHYVLAETDHMGVAKVMQLEKELHDRNEHSTFSNTTIPRSREVGQSYLSSVFTTLWAIVGSAKAVWNIKPDVVLCNGPGTCLPVVLVAFFLDLVRLRDTRVVFVESVCRVKTLSLTGKLLYALRLADVFLVQWKDLLVKYPRADCIGVLC